jgi:hypothetical protein
LCEGAVLPVSKEAAEDNDADNADNGKVSATFVNNKSTAKPQQL